MGNNASTAVQKVNSINSNQENQRIDGGNRTQFTTAGGGGGVGSNNQTNSPIGLFDINQRNMSMSRSASGTEISDKGQTTHFVPAEKLAKILQQKNQEEHGINGIQRDIFVKYVFPQFPDLGARLYGHLHQMARAQTDHVSAIAFRQQCERFLSILDDGSVLECYVKMFCEPNTELIRATGLHSLLMCCFQLAMAHYTDGLHRFCPLINRTIDTVIAACFFTKDSLSSGFVSRWLDQNCPRIVPPVHRFVLHTLSTAYRTINTTTTIAADNSIDMSSGSGCINLELATPILNNANPFDENHPPLMPISQAWLLASTLPPIYIKPQSISQVSGTGTGAGTASNSGTNPVIYPNTTTSATGNASSLVSSVFLMKMMSVVPSHWTLLYDTNQHGVGANRFLHHVLGYKGPTLCLFRSIDAQVICIASPTEWKESHLYTGERDSCIIQILPKYSLIECGPKLLYLNTCMRGYPKGLKAGLDPRRPLLSIDEHFEKIDIRGIQSELSSIEVWGCGDKQSRDIQLDIKKWQVKEAERQRTVKLTAADWLDNPDRYLLELGGRPQYNNA